MHYLVTGGAGFIGSHLCATLLQLGHQITVLDDFSTGKREHIWNGIRCVRGSVTDPACVAPLLADCDGVFHLAAIASVDKSHTEWRHTSNTNLLGTVTVLDSISTLARPIPCVFASSAAIYGDNDAMPLSEQSVPQPVSAYGVDKYASELHVQIATHMHGIPTSTMRFFNVYGERQDPTSPYSGVISIFANHMLTDKQVTIYGDGFQSRDFIYVGDVVTQLDTAMQRHHQESEAYAHCYAVCTGTETTINTLAATLSELTGYEQLCDYAPPKPGDIYRSLGDPTHMQAALATGSPTPLRQGLEATLRWMQQGGNG